MNMIFNVVVSTNKILYLSFQRVNKALVFRLRSDDFCAVFDLFHSFI